MAEKTGADLFALKQEMVKKFSLEMLKSVGEFEKAMGNLSDAVDVLNLSAAKAIFLARSGVAMHALDDNSEYAAACVCGAVGQVDYLSQRVEWFDRHVSSIVEGL